MTCLNYIYFLAFVRLLIGLLRGMGLFIFRFWLKGDRIRIPVSIICLGTRDGPKHLSLILQRHVPVPEFSEKRSRLSQ